MNGVPVQAYQANPGYTGGIGQGQGQMDVRVKAEPEEVLRIRGGAVC